MEVGRWGGERGKVRGSKCEIYRKMFLQRDLLKLCLKRNQDITKFYPDMIVFLDENN